MSYFIDYDVVTEGGIIDTVDCVIDTLLEYELHYRLWLSYWRWYNWHSVDCVIDTL
jgi:hypothetical protein